MDCTVQLLFSFTYAYVHSRLKQNEKAGVKRYTDVLSKFIALVFELSTSNVHDSYNNVSSISLLQTAI